MNKQEKNKEQHQNHGHRQRLRRRLLENGPKALTPDELIEMVLFLSIPRGDVKPLAKKLWKHYGSFQTLAGRPFDELVQIPGLGEQSIATLKTMHALALELTKPCQSSKPLLNAPDQIAAYGRLMMTPFEQEQCLIFYLNKKHQVLFEEIHQKGASDHVMIYPKEIIKKALNLSAYGIVLLHNHPEEEAKPSQEDDQLTVTLQHLCKSLNLELIDHLIITQRDFFSYQKHRWMPSGAH
jgi:DNA repair protein RadC